MRLVFRRDIGGSGAIVAIENRVDDVPAELGAVEAIGQLTALGIVIGSVRFREQLRLGLRRRGQRPFVDGTQVHRGLRGLEIIDIGSPLLADGAGVPWYEMGELTFELEI